MSGRHHDLPDPLLDVPELQLLLICLSLTPLGAGTVVQWLSVISIQKPEHEFSYDNVGGSVYGNASTRKWLKKSNIWVWQYDNTYEYDNMSMKIMALHMSITIDNTYEYDNMTLHISMTIWQYIWVRQYDITMSMKIMTLHMSITIKHYIWVWQYDNTYEYNHMTLH